MRAPALGVSEHGGAEIDPDNACAAWIEWRVAAGADPGVQDPARQAVEQQRPDPPITPVFERQVEQVVHGGNALIALQGGGHPIVLPRARPLV
jgi:hypothetical protein